MGIQHTDRAEERPPSPATMDERLARLERLLTAQQEHIARLEAERVSAPIAAAPLPVLLSVAPEQAAGDDAAPDVAAPPAPRHRGSSRRALLKLGGAAAAAGVAAMATAATELAHPGTAQASGIAWQTGVVNSDVQTFVEPANGSFPDPSLLAVRVGTAAPFQGLSSANSAAIAAYDTMASAIGLYATSFGGVAVAGRHVFRRRRGGRTLR